MPSALWAGSGRPTTPSGGTRLSIGFGDDLIAYELRLGLPGPPKSPPPAFASDPEVKEETIRTLASPRAKLLERRGLSVMLRDDEGRPQTFGAQLDIHESVLSQLAEPHRYPVLSMLRERLRRWRFYHQIRTDLDSPVRTVQVGTRTPVLAHDGHDLAPALQTILENGNDNALNEAVADALDGARLQIEHTESRYRLLLETPGVHRALDAAELSDGTLRYLALLAALQSPRPPELLVLNEPGDEPASARPRTTRSSDRRRRCALADHRRIARVAAGGRDRKRTRGDAHRARQGRRRDHGRGSQTSGRATVEVDVVRCGSSSSTTLSNAGLKLREGTRLVIHDASDELEDLEANATAYYDRSRTWWYAELEHELGYVPARDRSPVTSFLCLACRADLGPDALISDGAIVKRHSACPRCGLSLLAAIAPPA